MGAGHVLRLWRAGSATGWPGSHAYNGTTSPQAATYHSKSDSRRTEPFQTLPRSARVAPGASGIQQHCPVTTCPSLGIQKAASRSSTRRPEDGMPFHGPRCVPYTLSNAATPFRSATSRSPVTVRSGNAYGHRSGFRGSRSVS
jgi:hypothetical protein